MRERTDIKRWEVSKEIGVSRDTVRRWENGECVPSPDDVGNLERFYNFSGIVIDDKKLASKFRQELSEALAAMQKMMDRLPAE